ncbi:nuclease A inhibitor family protein [Leptolyngbya sp. FACHB-17]|uniref:nuclease A inhibitor family protein n=1 Tax=unclassified Leptolyngbya TaxID=2650499 RepID=UPI00103DCCFA|nr:nuclease A inhibitor family protein [Leptolyngbya sp. FACHB-17]MBD2078448.1 nuclease A inhibitor family protein [Leptolyngbya sp. FACHB-17]
MQEDDRTYELVAMLETLVENLTWMSETDAPIQVVCWENRTAIETKEQLLEQTKHSASAPVEIVDLDKFFAPVITEQDWFGDEEKETAARYRSLLSVLKEKLSDIKVYRVGEVEIDVYIVGLTEAKTVVGIAAQVVET